MRPTEPPAPAPGYVQRIVRAVVGAPDVPFDVARAAAACRMHPSALGRAFRRHVGCSISRFRQRVRVVRVARALLSGREHLTDLAFAYGFADLSHLMRVLRRELEVAPVRFRHRLVEPPGGARPLRVVGGGLRAGLKPFKAAFGGALSGGLSRQGIRAVV